jgi:hypothetical protein
MAVQEASTVEALSSPVRAGDDIWGLYLGAE